MTDKDLKITTQTCNGKKVINAPALTIIEETKKVKFYNELKSTGADPDEGVDLYIQFYEATESTITPVSATLVCQNYNEGDLFKVGANQHKNCKIDVAKQYKFDVAADGYDALDPVLIVEPPPFPLISSVAFAVAALVGLGAAYYVGFRRGSDQSKG